MGSRYYSLPVGIIDNMALGGGGIFPHGGKTGKKFSLISHGGSGSPAELRSQAGRRERGSAGFDAVLTAQGFSWQALPRGYGENDQTSPSVARLVKTNIRGIVHCRQPDAEIEARFGISM